MTNTATVEITYGDETILMTWEPAHASGQILVDGEPTPYQTADARHDTAKAVALACSYTWPEVEWPDVTGGMQDTDAWDDMGYRTLDRDALEEREGTIRLTRGESLLWDDAGPDGDAYRLSTIQRAQELADRTKLAVTIEHEKYTAHQVWPRG